MKRFILEVLVCLLLAVAFCAAMRLVEDVFPQTAIMGKYAGYFAVGLVVAAVMVHFSTKK